MKHRNYVEGCYSPKRRITAKTSPGINQCMLAVQRWKLNNMRDNISNELVREEDDGQDYV